MDIISYNYIKSGVIYVQKSEKIIDYASVGAKIRTARRSSKITQEQLAEICGLSTSYIGHIERGSRIPSLETLCKISSTLNISLDYMLLDSLPETQNLLTNISSALAGKEPEKVANFIKTVKILADNL